MSKNSAETEGLSTETTGLRGRGRMADTERHVEPKRPERHLQRNFIPEADINGRKQPGAYTTYMAHTCPVGAVDIRGILALHAHCATHSELLLEYTSSKQLLSCTGFPFQPLFMIPPLNPDPDLQKLAPSLKPAE